MKIKSQSLNMTDFIGGMVGWFAFQRSGFEKAFYVWDADVSGDDPASADTVLMKKSYLSIRTASKDREYIIAIAKHLLGEPHNFTVTQKEPGIFQVKQEQSK